jgi:hypothetical protein
VDFVLGGRRLEIEQRLDVAAHDILLEAWRAGDALARRTAGETSYSVCPS